MATHQPVNETGLYFITFTCFNWLQLIGITSGYDAVYNFFDVLIASGHKVSGYVIMPNHVHMLLYFTHGKASLNTVIGNGKRFIGYEIINRLKQQGRVDVLQSLSGAVSDVEKRRGKLHQPWQGTFDVKPCRTEKFILQKLNYIHANPCTQRWKLCTQPYEYGHSSAAYYEMGRKDNKWLTDYRDLLHLLEMK